MGTYFKQKDLETLRELRATLLGMEQRPAGEPAQPYWASARTLELYDRIFAARIGWKWEAVLDEVEQRGGLPAPRSVLDWGTGTGVASRTTLRRIARARAVDARAVDAGAVDAIAAEGTAAEGTAAEAIAAEAIAAEAGAAGTSSLPERVVLLDRDEAAREFAAASLRAEFPGLNVETTAELPAEAFDLVLASHVLDELSDEDVQPLLGAATAADQVLWVEPGSMATSRRLGEQRAVLLESHDVIAPCAHRGSCGVLAAGHERDWCHLFARPPAEVHTTGEWSEIHRELRIDLRSLPYSFLALRRASVQHPDAARLLGRPRFQKGRVLLDLCDAEGVETRPMLQRSDKVLFKALKETAGEVVLMERDGDRLTRRP